MLKSATSGYRCLVLPVIASGCIEYEPISSLPPQGVPNPAALEVLTQTDKLVQVQVPEVDILWTVDNSCSMFEEQAGIAENGPVFMDFFLGSGLDYHIGVVSTDMDDNSHSGKLRQAGGVRWVDEATPNPSQVFGTMIQMGTGGSSTERGRDASYGALEIQGDQYNAGFEREDAGLHVVVLSDESDYSSLTNLSEFISFLQTRKWQPDMTTFSSIVMYPPPEPGCVGAATPGDAYLAVTRQVGGIEWNICDRDWAQVLEQLGIQASGLRREYFLSQLPIESTLEVWVVENNVTYTFEKDIDWTYQSTRNSITFVEYVPSALSEVYVEYDVLSANEGQDE